MSSNTSKAVNGAQRPVNNQANTPNSAEPAESNAFSVDAFLSTYLPALILALGTGIALPAIPALARSFQISFGLASGVVTAFLLGGMVGSLPTGWFIDRFGRRKIMLAGPLLTAAMAFLVVTAHSFPLLLLYRFFDGWAAQMWLMGRMAAISARARPNQRGRQVSWMFGMDNLGRLSGPLAGGFIAASWGLRAPFAAYGVLALVALAVSFKYIKDYQPERRTASGASSQVRKPTIPELILPRLPFFGVALFAAMARGPIIADLLHLYAAFAYNLSPRTIGFLATGASCMGLPIGLTAGWLMDRFGRKKTMVPGFSGVAIGMLLLAMSAFLHLPLFWYVVIFLATVGSQSLTGGSVQTVGADVAPPDARGMFLGIWRFTGLIGTAFSPIAFAFLADKFGYVSSFISVSVAASILVFLLVVFVPETRKKPSAEPVEVRSAAQPAPPSTA